MKIKYLYMFLKSASQAEGREFESRLPLDE